MSFENKAIHHPYWTLVLERVGLGLILMLEILSKEIVVEAGGDHQSLESSLLSFLDDPLGYCSTGFSNLRQCLWDFGIIEALVVALPGGFIRVTNI